MGMRINLKFVNSLNFSGYLSMTLSEDATNREIEPNGSKMLKGLKAFYC